MIYAIGKPGGVVRQFVTIPVGDDPTRQCNAGEVAVGGALLDGTNYTISADGKSLIVVPVPLSAIQAKRWSDAKVYRQTKLTSGITTAKGVVQSDTKSRAFIDQSANSATRFKLNNQVSLLNIFKITNGTWSINFRMMDNSIVACNGDDMIAMAESVKTFDTACQSASDAIRTAIFAATTAAAVAAVDITNGYPS